MGTKYKEILVDCLVLADDIAIFLSDMGTARIQFNLLKKITEQTGYRNFVEKTNIMINTNGASPKLQMNVEP